MKFNQILSLGEILVEFVSHERNCGLEKIVNYSGPYPSGAPAIFIDQAARMGAQAQMIGTVGADGFGRITIERLKRDGVDVSNIKQSSDKSTGVAFVTYYDDGHRDFIFHLENTAADDIAPLEHVPSQALLHISASSLGNARLRNAILDLSERVMQNGGIISCDPNARAELMRDQASKEALERIVSQAQILLPSTSDLEFLFPNTSEDAALEKLLKGQAEIIALKRGAHGTKIFTQTESYSFDAFPVEEVDPTGAGDCFCGTFTALLGQGYSPQKAGQYANAAGALAVTKRGPMEGNSSFSEVEHMLAHGHSKG